FSEYFDRVNDAVRSYLGARYGFDGLESTTDEILAAMDTLPHFGAGLTLGMGAAPLGLTEIKLFLQECDLVKFANMTPTIDECQKALLAGERIVRATMPKERAFDADGGDAGSAPTAGAGPSAGAGAGSDAGADASAGAADGGTT